MKRGSIDAARLGRASEARFVMEAEARGLRAFIINQPGYDVLVDNGRRIFRVQVKASNQRRIRQKNRQGRWYSYQTYAFSFRGTHRSRGFDVFAGYLVKDDAWVLSPLSEVRAVIYPNSPILKHVGAWDIFQQG